MSSSGQLWQLKPPSCISPTLSPVIQFIAQCLQFPILTLSSFLSSCFRISCATPSKPTTGLRGQAEEIVSSHPRAIQINYTNRLLLQGVFNHKCHSEFPLGKSGIIFIHQNQLKYDWKGWRGLLESSLWGSERLHMCLFGIRIANFALHQLLIDIFQKFLVDIDI